MTSLYAQRKLAGICTRGCGREAAVDSQLCEQCGDLAREHSRRCRAFLRELRRDNGLCAECGALSETYRCESCRERKSVWRATGRLTPTTG